MTAWRVREGLLSRWNKSQWWGQKSQAVSASSIGGLILALMIFWLKTTRLPEIQKTRLPI
ncbi:MAG: hypothetical protein ACI87L_002056 [Litorivivens sp.]